MVPTVPLQSLCLRPVAVITVFVPIAVCVTPGCRARRTSKPCCARSFTLSASAQSQRATSWSARGETRGFAARAATAECSCVCFRLAPPVCSVDGAGLWSKDTKYVYRHYATLYFIFAVDDNESELGMLDLVQVFVETLDKCFESVCELDLIFNSDKVFPGPRACSPLLCHEIAG